MSTEAQAFRQGSVLGPMLCSWYMALQDQFLCLGRPFVVMQVIHGYLCSLQRVDTVSLETRLAAIKSLLSSNFLLLNTAWTEMMVA